MTQLSVPYKRLCDGVELAYAYEGDAGLDLRASVSMTLQPFERALVPTGVAFAIPEGYAGLIVPRSGLAAKHGVSIVNAPGLIDSGYRGEIQVCLINLDPQQPFTFAVGDRIAQIVFVPFAHAELSEQELSDSKRGARGFGSSGVI